MIRVVDVTQHYGVRPVLRNLNLHVAPGELMAVMGPNGMGKSTLLKTVAGILSPQKGYVEIAGKRRRRSVEEESEIRRQVFFLPANPWLPLFRTGRDYLLAVGKIYDVDVERLMDHIERLVRLFNLEQVVDTPMADYSTGQQKKIALCGALVSDAPVHIMDEPFSGGLDPSAILALKQVLQRLAAREDITVLMATPVPELVESVARRVAIIRDGTIALCDTIENLRRQAGGANNFEEALEKLVSPKTIEDIQRYFDGELAP